MSYAVREIFLSLQGEGFHAGRAAVLCRFAGCNLWSGREQDRAAAVCGFCDTDFVGTAGPGGGVYATAPELAAAVAGAWRAPAATGVRPLAVLTGGEPLLQVDAPLLTALHAAGLEVAVETNGTIPAPAGIDWLAVSPKAGAPLRQRAGDELKLVYPQAGLAPAELEGLPFSHFFLQPLDGPRRDEHARRAVTYCLDHPRWRVSLQMHKYLGIP